ncbi:tRNA (5-methylaminomethyl-2-thiouridine)(34)-methyltransferase MnmD [Zunongwangia sp.]|uniref:tRNA (5-methylaminomethyl-2-thiouridine)(34)-methyltransferase MnmD n=1 Tax=Zunongwangia sp. TaxID=1965325 RepID=UPI003AA81C21
MERKIIRTADGSVTIHLPELDEQYHSKHGAIQEAMHVYIEMGLRFENINQKSSISILEIGFGTGLNALLTILNGSEHAIQYTGVEAYPVSEEEIKSLDYPDNLTNFKDARNYFEKLHNAEWGQQTAISSIFDLKKRKQDFKDIQDINAFDLIYFDAFGARVQPELWTVAIFEKMYNALKKEGLLVTYAAKGSVRRAMQEVGFKVERLPGPPGKREMLRAVKN